ncbi:MAG TPA: hypothetical protein VFT48_05100 [Pyrinomonadaceae bacterium]|nr:hypothetical protein [Pyrinomonadaceae bacterium]
MPGKRPKRCFVLMPFTVREIDQAKYTDTNHWTEVYEGLIVPSVQKAGMLAERDDADPGSRLIVQGILEKLEEADLILCDLSSHNANVFLELGWALRADKPYVLIKDDLDDYVFDLNQQYTFSYSHYLKPTTLRHDIGKLADVIRRTIDDTERRYSLVKRMVVSDPKALNDRGFQTQLISEIQQKIGKPERIGRSLDLDLATFPWPELLSRATTILFAVEEELQKMTVAERYTELAPKLSIALDKLGALRNRDIQVGVIDHKRRWLFHDWLDLIGQNAQVGFFEKVLPQVFRYPHGAVAWADTASNLPMTFTPSSYKRLNIGLFSGVDNQDCKILVEAHHEVESHSEH